MKRKKTEWENGQIVQATREPGYFLLTNPSAEGNYWWAKNSKGQSRRLEISEMRLVLEALTDEEKANLADL